MKCTLIMSVIKSELKLFETENIEINELDFYKLEEFWYSGMICETL
jgi:hypothetical protein